MAARRAVRTWQTCVSIHERVLPHKQRHKGHLTSQHTAFSQAFSSTYPWQARAQAAVDHRCWQAGGQRREHQALAVLRVLVMVAAQGTPGRHGVRGLLRAAPQHHSMAASTSAARGPQLDRKWWQERCAERDATIHQSAVTAMQQHRLTHASESGPRWLRASAAPHGTASGAGSIL